VPPPELQPGDEFAGHRIEGVAGRGGMGVVYRARQLDLDRAVALKLIAGAMAEDDGFRDRFIRESRVAASIDHPNVIPVYYSGASDDGRLYIAMRYVGGDDLRTLVRREGPLPAERGARIVSQVAAALDAAHAAGMVHRDVKPANVLLGPRDHAYLTDFGLTKSLQSMSGGTRAGGWVGTLGYVAPEQIRGEPVDARTDVYALGCVLYYALTGATPYQRDSDEATLWAHLNDPPPPITARMPDVPAGFEDVIGRALAKDPAERFPSAGDLGRAALSAAGLASPDHQPPERVVATGAAAPPVDDETVISPSRSPTVRADPGPVATPGRSRPSGVLLLVMAISVLTVAGVVALLLNAGGDSPRSRSPTTTAPSTPVAPAAAGELVATVPAGFRPNAVVATADRVYVTSPGSSRIAAISTARNKPVRQAPRVGAGAASLAAGFGSLWVVKGNTQTLLRYGLRSGLRQGPPVALPSGQAVAVDVDPSGVWVGSRSGANRAIPQSVARVVPGATAPQRVIPVANGVQNIAVGGSYVWIVNRNRRNLTRLDIATGATRATATGRGAYAVAVADGRVWVTNQDEGTVTEYSARTLRRIKRIPVGRSPQGIAVGGGAVWVANDLDGTATRIDARTGKVVGRPVEVGTNPFAVAVHGRTAWFTLLGDNAVARVDFE
jgi:serine/threonine protein kinase/streptogramin lyase